MESSNVFPARNSYKSSKASFIMADKPRPSNDSLALGASFTLDSGGQIIDNAQNNSLFNSNITAGAIIRSGSSNNIKSLNMLIIGDPLTFKNIDNNSNKTLGSSIVVAGLTRGE